MLANETPPYTSRMTAGPLSNLFETCYYLNLQRVLVSKGCLGSRFVIAIFVLAHGELESEVGLVVSHNQTVLRFDKPFLSSLEIVVL